MMMHITLLLIIAYLLGSVPSAVIVCRLLRLPDPRKTGSHNPGTTNVLRIGGKKAAIITLIADMLKGFLPAFATHFITITPELAACVVLSAFLGHVFPLFSRFQGGKGVAILLGGLFGFAWLIGLLTLITWLVVASIWRYSSLAAMIAAALMPVYVFLLIPGYGFAPLSVLMFILLIRHKDNIKRLCHGTESKIGKKKTSASNDPTF